MYNYASDTVSISITQLIKINAPNSHNNTTVIYHNFYATLYTSTITVEFPEPQRLIVPVKGALSTNTLHYEIKINRSIILSNINCRVNMAHVTN